MEIPRRFLPFSAQESSVGLIRERQSEAVSPVSMQALCVHMLTSDCSLFIFPFGLLDFLLGLLWKGDL